MQKNIQYAGEYRLKELLLHTSAGNVLPLTQAVQSIDIYEDMFSTSLSGVVTILDVDNIAENGPIIGQEFITLKISTPTLDDEKIEIMFATYKVETREAINQDVQFIAISFTSIDLLNNKKVRISQSYTDQIHDIIEEILRDTRYIGTDRPIFIEKTAGIRKVICPNLHPYDFINNLINEAQTEKDGAPFFFFFENLKGIQVKSLGSILADNAVGDFNTGDLTVSPKDRGVTIDIEKDFNRALEFQINSNSDMLLNRMSGMLGSKTINYNIYNKSFDTFEYDYFKDFEKFPRLHENPSYNDIGENFSNSRIFLHPTNFKGATDSSHTNTTSAYFTSPSGISNAIAARRAKLMELNNGVSITMKINGNTTISAGQTMNLTVPVSGRAHDKENDKFYSGRYLITKARHTFNQPDKRHEILLTASKDSLPSELPSVASPIPRTKSGSTTLLT
tara:strand:- start:1561 stop:2907 length:1347 start_codon:yes stop_codon:yes gene_type:complete